MSENTHTQTSLTEDDIRSIVRDELQRDTQHVAESIPFSRREIIKGATFLGTSVAVGGLGVYGAVGRAAAQDGGAGSGTIGTSSDPLEAIYVNELHQNTDVIDTGELSIDGSELDLNGTPSSPSEGDVRITEDTS